MTEIRITLHKGKDSEVSCTVVDLQAMTVDDLHRMFVACMRGVGFYMEEGDE